MNMNIDRDDNLLIPPVIRAHGGFFSIFSTLINNNINFNDSDNNGVSEEFKNNLEELVADEEFIKKDKQCSICLEDFKLGDKYIRLPCQTENEDEKHIFHSGNDACSGIKPWLERNNTCPMCRTEFPKENSSVVPVFETITFHTLPPINNILREEFNDIMNENIPIPDPNDLDNSISNIITNYINEIEESNEQRDIQLAIEASLQINMD
jgi:hypothetical protein